MPKQLILCNCSESQQIDREALEAATGMACSKLHTGLCTHQLADAHTAIASEDAIICCEQETRVFQELADELAVPEPAFVDLRDRAGWSADGASKLPLLYF